MRIQYTLTVLALAAALHTDAAADQKAPPVATAKPAAGPKCRAMDGTKKIAEASGASTSDCSFALREDVKSHFCKAGSKGKSFKFTVEFDHKLGARSWPTAKDQMYCANEVK